MMTPFALVLAMSLTAPAGAVDDPPNTIAGVTMPATAEVGGQSLVLNGMGLRKKSMFKVYVAGLYLPAKNTSADAVLAADTPRRVVMQFVRGVGPDKMCEAWDEGLEANTPNASAELKDQFKTLCSWMVEMKDKGQLVFTYEPGKGTTVEAMGQMKGTMPGKEFADAIFKCWIGPKPGPGQDFKNGLMGVKS